MIRLDPDEKIEAIVRKHWIVLAVQTFVFIVLMPAPYLIYRLIPLPPFVNVPGNHSYVFVFFGLLWILGLWFFFFIGWTLHHLDAWVVTNKRIVDIEQNGLFSREETSFRLDRIQDITVETHGILATLFGFGAIHVQTAGEEARLELPIASSPEKIKDLIMGLSNKMIEKFPNASQEP